LARGDIDPEKPGQRGRGRKKRERRGGTPRGKKTKATLQLEK